MSCMCQYNSRVTGGEGSRMEIEERKDLYHGISSSRKETFSFNERSGRVFFFAFSQCSCGASAAPMQESSESDEDTD